MYGDLGLHEVMEMVVKAQRLIFNNKSKDRKGIWFPRVLTQLPTAEKKKAPSHKNFSASFCPSGESQEQKWRYKKKKRTGGKLTYWGKRAWLELGDLDKSES